MIRIKVWPLLRMVVWVVVTNLATQNGLNVLDFDGTQRMIVPAANKTQLSAYTKMFVVSLDTTTNNGNNLISGHLIQIHSCQLMHLFRLTLMEPIKGIDYSKMVINLVAIQYGNRNLSFSHTNR